MGRRWHCPRCLRSAGHSWAPSAGAGQGQMGALEHGLGREPGAAGQGSPLPVRVLAEHGRVTHHNQQSLGPRDGHVEPLRREKSESFPLQQHLSAPPQLHLGTGSFSAGPSTQRSSAAHGAPDQSRGAKGPAQGSTVPWGS